MRWRDRLAARNAALRDYFVLSGQERTLRHFHLAGYGTRPNFGYGLTANECLRALAREQMLLDREIAKREAAGWPAEPGAPGPTAVAPQPERPEPLRGAQ
jgi:hypothetical protein